MKPTRVLARTTFILAFILAAAALTACVRPAQNDELEDSELEESAIFEPTAEETVLPEATVTEEPTDVAELPTVDIEAADTPEPTQEAQPTDTPEATPVVVSPLIEISEPDEGAVLDTALTIDINGVGQGLPEGNVVVEIRDSRGIVLASTSTVLQGEEIGLGGSGTWEVSFMLAIDSGTEGQIYAFSESPADGAILAEDSVNVTFYETVEEPFITITSPLSGTVLVDDPVVISGTGGGLFEGNVVVQAEDSEGNMLAMQSTILEGVNAGMGGSGDWETSLSFSVPAGTPGRIIAYSNSPADGSLVASDSIDVIFGEPGESVIHIVQPGETLYRISLIYGVTVADIMAANDIFNPDIIYAGQELIIPAPSP